jgi:ankyrin repeat protein
LLISKAGIIDHNDRTNRKSVHYAVDRDHTSVLQEILRKTPSLLIQDTNGMNPVLSAAQEGNRPCLLVQLFINDNARLNISTCNTNRDLPNHMAASLGHIKIVSWLIEGGVAIDCRSGKLNN